MLENSETLTYEQAEEILNARNYVGAGDMRGRQSFNPIKKMGLAKIDDQGRIRITSFGEYLLKEDADLGEMFFKSFLKWQLPNPLSRDFKVEDGYDIKPFIATLHLINKVNKICRKRGLTEKGLSQAEFDIFVPTLISYQNIQAQARKVLEFRTGLERLANEREKQTYTHSYVSENFEDFENMEHTKDYGDNIRRYFRMTRYFHLRGNGYYIDLEPRRSIEIQKILKTDNGSSQDFTAEAYIDYISDINLPILPWETQTELVRISNYTADDIRQYQNQLREQRIQIPDFEFKNTDRLSVEQLKAYVGELRDYRRTLQETEDHFVSQNVDKVREYIDRLRNIRQSKEKKSIELEHLATLALNAINDALAIKPNYPVGDDNQPTFTAPANKPDIECFYDAFNGVCEVTMLTNRAQWMQEGQPVMRHLRDFEDANNSKDTYCLFVAPTLHRDTVNTFWTAVKYEYEGRRQKIVPLTINELAKLLEAIIAMKDRGQRLDHRQLMNLYDSIINLTSTAPSSDVWTSQISGVVEQWSREILSAQV
ncbi:MAG: hypothetical protein UV83_C0006G0017 [candidate division WWE3 bacterium GW2011_GWE2_43_18]|nr:MAG: hypothetical protein UU91_C0008G0030 [candidate division WWE3 bacterium GW2011_GWB1_42_117]KKT05188.1 MAG: hypothetical protein UV83_C0006G0017 [candidate division WWE3 bacterium GW2011_GWE2_43_18]KKT06455.1 MAG: hypothetical protein UV84_C0007G0017 [candidate division WWE3 bacterium GW2011_GWF2_43_18]KKT26816.1 MAG: hypothetical protein UW13_C0008G0030 [candidate division WWE3 bacterium GW2011_GWA1_43_94]KKT44281.1 MAG: hypothetical protein UW33_C0008G0017 [candidate division WWE3 bact